MFKETINSTKQSNANDSPFKQLEKNNQSDNDSIFNIEFNDIPGQGSVKDLLNNSYVNNRAKKTEIVVPK